MLNPKYYKVPKVTTKRKQVIRPEWNDQVTDSSKFKLTNQELMYRKIAVTSKNLEYVKSNQIVQKRQSEILNDLKTKKHQRSLSNISRNEYVNKYRIDSTTLSNRKLLNNTSFSKSSTGRLTSLNNKKEKLDQKLITDSFNIRHNERERRLEYGLSISRSNSYCNSKITSLNGSFASTVNKAKEGRLIDNTPKIEMQKNCLFIKTKAVRRNPKKQQQNNNKIIDVNDSTSDMIKYSIDQKAALFGKNEAEQINQGNTIRTLSTLKEDKLLSDKDKNVSKSIFTYPDEEDDAYSYCDKTESKAPFSNFQTEKRVVKESLDDCLSKLNNVMKACSYGGSNEKADNIDYYNKAYHSNAVNYGETNDAFDYSNIKNSITNDFNKYSFLLNQDNTIVDENHECEDHIDKQPDNSEYDYRRSVNSSNAMEYHESNIQFYNEQSHQSNENHYNQYNHQSPSNSHDIFDRNVQYTFADKDKEKAKPKDQGNNNDQKVSLKNISYHLKNMLKNTNDTIKQLNNRFNN